VYALTEVLASPQPFLCWKCHPRNFCAADFEKGKQPRNPPPLLPPDFLR
jgi:hypothetical protein